MSSVVDVIVISSDDDETAVVKQNYPKKEIIDLTVSPTSRKSRYSRSFSKSQKRRRKSLRSSGITSSDAPSSINSLRFDPSKVKQLRAVVMDLTKSPSSKIFGTPPKKLDNDFMVISTNHSQAKTNEKVYSNGKTPPKQRNLIQYLTTPPKLDRKTSDCKETLSKHGKMPSKGHSLEGIHEKMTCSSTQSSIDHWVTPTKKDHVKEVPVSPSCNVHSQRNELIWPPQHVLLNTNEFIERLYKDSREFPTTFMYMLESIKDEELLDSYLSAINTFMSRNWAPSPEIILYLLNIIFSHRSSPRHVCMIYGLLNEIILKYPKKCIALNVSMRDVRKYFFNEAVDANTKIAIPFSKLGLSFLLSVLSVELKATALKKQNRLTKNYSADFNVKHARDAIPHLKKCLTDHTAISGACSVGDHDVLPEEIGYCGLELLQNLLKLYMVVSLDKEYSAVRLADVLMDLYIELPSLEQRVLLLQSVKSHFVRQHLCKVLLMNYCSLLPEALKGYDQELSMRKILFQDFYRKPPNHSDEFGYSEQDVEEYVTLLAYLMQSYLVLRSSTLRRYHNDYPLCDHDNIIQFRPGDLTLLDDLEVHVSALRNRCQRFVKEGQRISSRTKLLLVLMSDLKYMSCT